MIPDFRLQLMLRSDLLSSSFRIKLTSIGTCLPAQVNLFNPDLRVLLNLHNPGCLLDWLMHLGMLVRISYSEIYRLNEVDNKI